jgi:hypothetical protein
LRLEGDPGGGRDTVDFLQFVNQWVGHRGPSERLRKLSWM